MRLVVKKGDQTVNELRFSEGPVRIGRRSSSDVSLRHPSVSKQHAVISNTDDGKWTIEDLDSANKTYLNDHPIHKAELKTGDRIRIAGFTIEVELEGQAAAAQPDAIEPEADISDLDDLDIGKPDAEPAEVEKTETAETQAAEVAPGRQDPAETAAQTQQAIKPEADKGTESGIKEAAETTDGMMVASREPQIIVRKIDAEKSPPVRFDSERVLEFLQVIDAVSKTGTVDDVLLVLLEAVAKQFGACYVWSALRNQPSGPMTAHAGRLRDGRPLDFTQIPLNEKINEAIDKGQFLLLIFSRDMDLEKGKQVRSALIAPILNSTGCYGAIYVNNTFRDDHYDLGDLDYLMFICIHAATVLQKL